MFSKFFINRPIFATVLALLIVVAGLVALNILPVAQFPEITPPTVQVSAVYPGANAETVAQTVGLPIEQQVNGVDGMLYMSSNSSSSGAYSLTITFAVGTDIDMATVQVQNRVSVAQSSLPEPVVVQGVTVQKQSSNIVMFLTMTSKDSVYNSLYLTNYAKLNLVDQLSRVPGVGAVNVMGAGDYSMRIWLDPEAMRIRNISPAQVYQSIQSQNMEVSAGYIGQPIGQDNKNAFQYTLNVQGRLTSPEQFGNIIIRREQDGAMLRLKDIARIDLGAASYSVVSRLKGMPTAAIAIYQQPGSNSLDVSKGVKAKMEELATSFPTGVAYNVTLDTTDVIHASIDEVMVTFFETTLLVVLVIFPFMYYETYGDDSLIKKYYQHMRRYTDYLKTRADNGILSFGLGDWYDYGDFRAGFSRNTPVPLVATAHYYMTVMYLIKAARMVGNEFDVRYYSSLAYDIMVAFNKRFLDSNTAQYGTGSQASNALPIFLQMIQSTGDKGDYTPDASLAAKVLTNLIKDVESHGNRLTTGDVGNRYLIQTLARNGQHELIYKMFNHEEAPGYGFQLKFGATTLTEQWDPRQGSSWNHFMMGQIDEWFFNSLIGIRPSTTLSASVNEKDEPMQGYQKFVIAPKPVGDLKYVKSTYETLYGTILVDWTRQSGTFTLNVSVPVNTTAIVYLPGEKEPKEVQSGTYKFVAAE